MPGAHLEFWDALEARDWERFAATRVDFTLDGEPVPGVTFFTLGAGGLITSFVESGPEPYEPPEHRGGLLERC